MLLKKVMKQLWQCVQGYMGDLVLSYPSMLAQEVLRIALEYPCLKDEIYCILLKQVCSLGVMVCCCHHQSVKGRSVS